MKSLLRVSLTNFQSHASTVIDLDAASPSLTVITGPSDSGKTAILRAIRWALYNEPSGDAFIRVGAKEASVTLTFDDGTTIERRKGKGVNAYLIHTADKDLRFDNFGTAVPEEVAEATGMPVAEFGDIQETLHLQSQLDAPFLLSLPGSVGAKVLGRLAGTEIVDIANRTLAGDVRRRLADEKQATSTMVKCDEALKPYEDLDERKDRCEEAQGLVSQVVVHSNTRDNLHMILQEWTEATGNLRAATERLTSLGDLDTLAALLQTAQDAVSSLAWLIDQRTKLDAATGSLEVAEQRISALGDTDYLEMQMGWLGRRVQWHGTLTALKGRLDEALGTWTRTDKTLAQVAGIEEAGSLLEATSAKGNRLHGLRWEIGVRLVGSQKIISEAEATIERESLREANAIRAYQTMLHEAGKCPTCGGEVHEEHVVEVLA